VRGFRQREELGWVGVIDEYGAVDKIAVLWAESVY
jgi:hypothetical protein